MNYSAWYSPQNRISTQTEPEVAVRGSVVPVSTVTAIRTVSTSTGLLIGSGSQAQFFTGFAHTGMVNTVQLRLVTSRVGRIQDSLIQIQDSEFLALSPDVSNPRALDDQIYDIQLLHSVQWDQSLGVLLDFQPHVQYPSSNTLYIRSVLLRFAE